MASASLRLIALAGALAIYGAFSSPTPPTLGLVEVITGILLMIAVSPQGIISAFVSRHNNALWQASGRAFLIYGLGVSPLIGIMENHSPGLIIRDVIPFFFLMIPILVPPFQGMARGRIVVLAMAVFIGVAFSARIVWPLLSGHMNMIGTGADPLYLSIAPTVVFAAIILGALAGKQAAENFSIISLTKAVVLAALACLPFAAMAITLQRAGLVLAVAALGFLLMVLVIRNPVRAAGPVLLVILTVLAFAPTLGNISRDLVHKHDVVGLNMRWQEAEAVADSAGASIGAMLFGQGWGTTLSSPAVGGVTVNYTHCLLTALWLKTGLVGLILAGLYLVGLAQGLFPLLWRNPVMAVALAVPLVIDTLLYASYKSLDFGVILFLIALHTDATRVRGHNLTS